MLSELDLMIESWAIFDQQDVLAGLYADHYIETTQPEIKIIVDSPFSLDEEDIRVMFSDAWKETQKASQEVEEVYRALHDTRGVLIFNQPGMIDSPGRYSATIDLTVYQETFTFWVVTPVGNNLPPAGGVDWMLDFENVQRWFA